MCVYALSTPELALPLINGSIGSLVCGCLKLLHARGGGERRGEGGEGREEGGEGREEGVVHLLT